MGGGAGDRAPGRGGGGRVSAPLRVALVDDERLARAQLRRLLAVHPGVEVVGEADAVAPAARLVRDVRPDALFLDIQLGGETGFDLLDALDAPVAVVFVTAYDHHAVRAFEVNALDYLLKPADPGRLARSVARLRAGAAPGDPAAGRPLDIGDRLFVEVQGRPQFVAVRDILAVRAADDYTTLVVRDGRRPLVLAPLATWEARLPGREFARVHRSALVQLAAVARVEPWSHGTFQLHLHGVAEPVPMSRRAAAALRVRLR